jgi:bifunctional DNase/RNase
LGEERMKSALREDGEVRWLRENAILSENADIAALRFRPSRYREGPSRVKAGSLQQRRDSMYVEMKVKFLTFDSTSNGFVVLLMDLANKTGLPIWIGPFEANAIAMKLKKIGSQRPMTHDLIHSILNNLESKVIKIVVNDLKENTYYALIYLNRKGDEIVIDSRPSDAIAIALAVDAPIFVSDQVIEKAKTIDMEKEVDQLKEWLENLNLMILVQSLILNLNIKFKFRLF